MQTATGFRLDRAAVESQVVEIVRGGIPWDSAMPTAEPGAPRRRSWGGRLLRVRWLVRAPIGLFRARLGFVFGNRLLLLEHVGRASALPRYVTLEVVDHPSRSRYVVASGFGRRAEWFRNIEANPHVRVTVGSRRPRAALTQVMAAADAAETLGVYRAAHPRAWAALTPVFSETLGEQLRDDGSNLPLVRIDLD